jgi:signal transduction histidine kinase
VAAQREKKKTAGQKDWQRATEREDSSEQVRQAAQDLENAAASLEQAADASDSQGTQKATRQAEELRDLAATLSDAAENQRQHTATLLQELAFLRILASLGLSVGEFTHEVSYLLPSIQAECNYFSDLHRGQGEPARHSDKLSDYFGTLRSFTAYFGTAIEDNAQREIRVLDLARELRRFEATMGPVARRYGIEIGEPQVRGYELIACPMHPSEWVSILMNLFTNSKKAIYRAKSPGRIVTAVGRESGTLYVEFSDNGDGIPTENQQRVFDAFFTTTALAGNLAPEADEARGTGLGLKIVADIVSAYRGSVRVVFPPAGFSTCLRVEVPEATDEEKRRYGY